MKLSATQLAVMHQNAVQGFERRLMLHLRETFAERLRPMSDEQLQAALRACCDRAFSHGIDIEDDVRRYAEFAVTYGLDMDRDPRVAWIGTVLKMEHLSGTRRMDLLDALEPRFLRSTA